MALMMRGSCEISDYEKIADIIMSHSEIDKIMSELLAAFINGSSELARKIDEKVKLSFEQKRVFLIEIIRAFEESNWKKELLFFLNKIQDFEQYRNKIAHGNTLREILRKKTIKEIPYLKNNLVFQKDWPQDIDIDDMYQNYNAILETKNPYLDTKYLIEGKTDNLYFLIDRLEQIPPNEIIEEMQNARNN